VVASWHIFASLNVAKFLPVHRLWGSLCFVCDIPIFLILPLVSFGGLFCDLNTHITYSNCIPPSWIPEFYTKFERKGNITYSPGLEFQRNQIHLQWPERKQDCTLLVLMFHPTLTNHPLFYLVKRIPNG
jgi:hypothetical protein